MTMKRPPTRAERRAVATQQHTVVAGAGRPVHRTRVAQIAAEHGGELQESMLRGFGWTHAVVVYTEAAHRALTERLTQAGLLRDGALAAEGDRHDDAPTTPPAFPSASGPLLS